MGGSKFWARGAERQQESEKSDGAQVLAASLTAADRCDRCGARTYVRVLLPNFLELLFCAHHNRQYASALTNIAVESTTKPDNSRARPHNADAFRASAGGLADEKSNTRPATGRKHAMNGNLILTGAVSYGTNGLGPSRWWPADYRGDRNG